MNVKENGELAARLIFNLVLRLIGLLFLYQGLSVVPTAFGSICPVFPHVYWRNVVPSLLLVGWPLVVGYWLVSGAPWLMRLAYPERGESTADRRT